MKRNLFWLVAVAVMLLLAAWQTWGAPLLSEADTVTVSATIAPVPTFEPTAAPESSLSPTPYLTATPEPTPSPTQSPAAVTEGTETMVWIPVNGGTKYHSTASCSGMIDPERVTVSEAIELGFEPCKRCW